MVSPLKGLTRAVITARAAARRAAEAAKKGQKRKGKKGKKSTGRVRVSQKTVSQVKSLGRAKARAQAARPGASAEFKAAVNRIYPTKAKKK